MTEKLPIKCGVCGVTIDENNCEKKLNISYHDPYVSDKGEIKNYITFTIEYIHVCENWTQLEEK